MRNTKLITAATLMLAVTGAAWAGPKHRDAQPYEYFDQARVVSSTPIYEEFNEPRRECWTEQVSYEAPRDRSYGGAIVGGIVGGILGNQVGKGTGKTVATAVGAATGAMVGDNVDNRGRPIGKQIQTEDVERCRTVDNWSRRVAGYDVVYRFQGRNYSTVLPYDPGNNLRLKVNVSVAERW